MSFGIVWSMSWSKLSTPMVPSIWGKSFSLIPICLLANSSVFIYLPIKWTKLRIYSLKMVNFGGCGPKLVNCLSGLGDPYKQQRMKVLKSVFDFYLDASIHVAMAVLSLAGVSFLLMGTIPDIKLLGFIFFSVIVGYNFIKYGVEAYKYLIVSNAYHKFIQAFSFVSFGFSLLFFLRLEVRLWWAIGALGLMSALYAVPFLPRAKNLRSLAGLKIHIVALVWAGFTVLLPAIDAHLSLDWDFWVLFIQRFLLV